MTVKKEPLEIECSDCHKSFRLWIPVESLPEWESGSKISCIRCGARYLIKKNADGFLVALIKDTVSRAKKPEPVVVSAPAPPPPPPPEAPAPPKAATRGTILLLDDDRLAREMTEHSFKESGFGVIISKNAAEGLRELKKQKIDLIVTDLHLKNSKDPEATMDGEEFLVKANQIVKNLPAVITTGKDIVDDLVLDPKWFDLHVKGFIQKGNPFWVEELKLKIQEVLHRL
ncbi:response regulator [bacterium]|nr:MAG: response regulator [bacterium]